MRPPPRNTVHPAPLPPEKPVANSFIGVLPKTPSSETFDLYEPDNIHHAVAALKISPSTQALAFSSTAVRRPAHAENTNACFQVLSPNEIFDSNAEKIFKMKNVHGEKDSMKDIYAKQFEEMVVDSLQSYSNCESLSP